MDALIKIGQYLIAHAPELSGIILPPIVDYINRDVKTDKERYIVTLLVCFATAIFFHWNELMAGSVEQLLTTFSIIFVESQTIFKLYFKNSVVREKLLTVLNPPVQENDTIPAPPQQPSEAQQQP